MKTQTFYATPAIALREYQKWFDTKKFETVEVSQTQIEDGGLSIIVVYLEFEGY